MGKLAKSKKPVKSKSKSVYDRPLTKAEIGKVLVSMYYPHLLVSAEELKARKERAAALKARLKTKGKKPKPLSKKEFEAFQFSMRLFLRNLATKKVKLGYISKHELASFRKILRDFPQIYKTIREEERIKNHVKVILEEAKNRK